MVGVETPIGDLVHRGDERVEQGGYNSQYCYDSACRGVLVVLVALAHHGFPLESLVELYLFLLLVQAKLKFSEAVLEREISIDPVVLLF